MKKLKIQVLEFSAFYIALPPAKAENSPDRVISRYRKAEGTRLVREHFLPP